ncbi:kelch-like protein 35 [Arctopsyche grandis]|uniref:kelch-like protein 35 n=1 Tax=Arctopsyche grandis TaxID=121162 RepID=UPI00406D7D53
MQCGGCEILSVFYLISDIEENLYEKFKDLATQLEIYNLYYKKIDVTNSLEALNFSSDPASIETAMYFVLENFEKLYKTPDFLNLPFSALTEIIKSDYLCVSSEAHVMKSIRMWVDEDDDKRRSKLKELLNFVKLPGLAMEINITDISTGYYSSSGYTRMVRKVVQSILEHRKNTSQRWKSVKIVLIVGNSANGSQCVEVFDSKNNSWTATVYNFQRYYFALALVNDWILIIGGSENSKMEYLDLKDGLIRTLNPMRQNRWRFSAVAISHYSSTDVYAIGGQHFNKDDGVMILSSVERWNSKSNSWDFIAPLLRAIYSHSSSVIDDKIFVTGGRLHDGTATNRVQMYSKNSSFWSYCTSMKQSRYDHSSVAINGKLYVAGGMTSENLLDTVELFDPEANMWTIISRLPSPRSGISLCNFRNKLLCIGGMNHDAKLLKDVLEYDDENKNWKILKSLNQAVFVSPTSAFVIPYDSVLI